MLSKTVISLALLTTLVSASCKSLPQGKSAGKTSNVTIKSSGIPRSYLISLPPAYDCEIPIPVILSFHGANRNASQQQKLSQMSNPQFNDFAIAVYPLGLDVLILP
jgi:poly(3-hydroxybutyrate) depolymerase